MLKINFTFPGVVDILMLQGFEILLVEGILAAFQKKIEDLDKLIGRLELVDPHEAFVLLKNFFSIPKLQYILRTTPTFLCENELVRFGEKVRDELQAILSVDLQDGAWT